MASDPRYEVVNPAVEAKLKELGGLLGKALEDFPSPQKWGFGLFLFEYGENGSMFWISSAERGAMFKALQEFIQKNRPQ